MRPLWKGTLGFGLVMIPVRIYRATEDRNPSFRQLHSKCSTPIRYLKWCPTCNREVDADEIVRGIEYEKGSYVVLSEEDVRELPVPEEHRITITEFCRGDEVDPVYFRDSFFLEPQEGSGRAYSLIFSAMRELSMVAVARVALRSRETPALVRPYDRGVLMLETMYWADEIRPVENVRVEEEPLPTPQEKEMAVTLVRMMARPFEPEKHVSEYRKKLRELVQAKLRGMEVVREPERKPPAEVMDLMEALRRSIAGAGVAQNAP